MQTCICKESIVEIVFEEASREWLKNKNPDINKGFRQGYVYVCSYIHSNGKKCKKATNKTRNVYNTSHPEWIVKTNPNIAFCKQHSISGPRNEIRNISTN